MRLLIINLILLTWTTSSIGQGIESKKREKEKNKRTEEFTKWLRKNDIVLGQLPKADPTELIYDCDSVPIIKQVHGDTLIYWTKSSWYTTGGIYLDNDIKELNKLIKKESFGRTDYVEKLDDQGNVVVVFLTPTKFKIQNDSLYQLEALFKVPVDSIGKAIERRQFELAEKLFKENIYFKFVLVFHPNLFDAENSFKRNDVNDIVTLDRVWKIDEKKYYQITFQKEVSGQITRFPSYILDEKYRLLNYDGCNKTEIGQLTKDKEIKITN